MEKSFNVPLPHINEQLRAKKELAPELEHDIIHSKKRAYEVRYDKLSTNRTRSVRTEKIQMDFQKPKITFEEFINRWEKILAETLSIPRVYALEPQLNDLSWYLGLQKDHDEIEWLALVLTLHEEKSGSTFLDAFKKMMSWAKVLIYLEATSQGKVPTSHRYLETSNLVSKILNILRKIANSRREIDRI